MECNDYLKYYATFKSQCSHRINSNKSQFLRQNTLNIQLFK